MWVLAVHADGKVLMGGLFTTVNGTAHGEVARLNADGTLDTTFGNGQPGANSTVFALALQPDSKVVIGGAFTTVNGVTRGGALTRSGWINPFASGSSGAPRRNLVSRAAGPHGTRRRGAGA